MTRITRYMLYQQLTWLNRAADEHYELSIWSPGDGWTRYQLLDPTGHPASPVCNGREMYAALYTANEILGAHRNCSGGTHDPLPNPL